MAVWFSNKPAERLKHAAVRNILYLCRLWTIGIDVKDNAQVESRVRTGYKSARLEGDYLYKSDVIKGCFSLVKKRA